MSGTATSSEQTVLDSASLPIEQLAALAAREGKRPRAIYGAHKWFARRAGTAFRALLVGSQITDRSQFWPAFEGTLSLDGVRVLDPFVGGGTSVVEASLLGAEAIGVDVDPVACAVTSFETSAAEVNGVDEALTQVREAVLPPLQELYTSQVDGEARQVLHFFWVQVVECASCRMRVEAHPSYRLAWKAETKRQWAFCRCCHRPQELAASRRRFTCECGASTELDAGTVNHGTLSCPVCGTHERLIDVAERTGERAQFDLFALEVLPRDAHERRRVPINERGFVAATTKDRELVRTASDQLGAAEQPNLRDAIPQSNRSDDRLIRYGYRRYRELFNPRQSLHLRNLAAAIQETEEPGAREALSMAFSDHLTTNCMLTCYAGGWRRLVPLFAIKAFRHIPRPVEINPWMDGIGRGSYPNAVRQVTRSIAAARNPSLPMVTGGERRVRNVSAPKVRIINGTATDLSSIADASIDLVLTDPPYFDNVDYSELADFFRPWLAELNLASDDRALLAESLAVPKRDEAHAKLFSQSLGRAFTEIERVLSHDGRLVFTFRHRTKRGWEALERGLAKAPGLVCRTVFPLLAEGTNHLHTHDETVVWDAVLVFSRTAQPAKGADLADGAAYADLWISRLDDDDLAVPFRDADAANFRSACELAARRGATFASQGSPACQS